MAATIDPRLAALEPLVGRLLSFYQRVDKLTGSDDVLWLRIQQLNNFVGVDWTISDETLRLVVSSLGSVWLVLWQMRRAELPLELDAERIDLMDATVLAKAGTKA
jgi:hypothetical protein